MLDCGPTLREQDFPIVGSDSKRVRVPDKFGLVGGEVFENQGGEISILSEVQQVLHVKRINPIFLVFVNDLLRHKERLVRVGSSQSVNGETPRQTGDRSKERFERLREVM